MFFPNDVYEFWELIIVYPNGGRRALFS